jgi:sterol desaturase/sphingolipid hydroxylase (fatty acid hydroxylase superfamily)
MVESLAVLITGLFTWTFVEYVIHGWLSHTFHTFATALHAVHHRDPDAVFTIGAWIPIAVVWIVFAGVFGWTSGMTFFSGAVSGFIFYEAVHYRFHFCRPRGRFETYLRARHLVHHEHYPNRCFGVTSALWDLVFGTEPMDSDMAWLCESMASKPPSNGRTNLYKLPNFVLPWRKKRIAWRV